MAPRASRPSRERGFTLMEMMVVMILLGVIAGLGFAGFDSMDPGHRGLQVSLENFLEASRDRARGSGQEVRVLLIPPTEENGARLQRAVFRSLVEAGFEPSFAAFERVQTEGGARLGGLGRCGAGLDLSEGGSAVIEGRGGQLTVADGFALEFDIHDPGTGAGQIAAWPGLLEIDARRGAGWLIRLRAGESEFMSWVQLEVPAHLQVPGRWQHLRVAAAEGLLQIWLDGELAGQEVIGLDLGQPSAPLRLGSNDAPFHGRLDEVVIWTRVREEGPELPDQVAVVMSAPALVFDRQGMLDLAAHPATVRVGILDGPDEIGAFQVGRFTQEAAQ